MRFRIPAKVVVNFGWFRQSMARPTIEYDRITQGRFMVGEGRSRGRVKQNHRQVHV